MGILGDSHTQPGGPPNPSQFPSDSVLGRVARGGYKPTDVDLEELRKLAQSGNRAERRAATKHLKKQGIVAPPAEPRAPVVMPVDTAPAPIEQARAKPAATTQRPPAKQRAAEQAPVKQAAASKPAPRKAPAKEAAASKAPPKKAAARKAAPKKPAPVKAAPKKTAAKKAAVKKATKKAPAKTRRKK